MTHDESRQLNEKILQLREVEKLTNSVVAERLNLTVSNVAQRYKRAKDKRKESSNG